MVVHPTAYDGCLELGAMQLGYGVLGSNMSEQNYRCAKEIVKTHLVQDCVCVSPRDVFPPGPICLHVSLM